MGENVSAVIKKELPIKCKDPGTFTIPCTIGNTRFERAMLDLGASINVIPYSIYASLNLGPLQPTGVVIQLADRSNAYPKGVVEDVLVQVNELVFPADFYVLDMEEDKSLNSAPILLGRPFLKTARTKIDVHSGVLTMEFDGEIIRFNIFEAMRYPSDVHSACLIDSYSQEEKKNDEGVPQSESLHDAVAALHEHPSTTEGHELPVTINAPKPSVVPHENVKFCKKKLKKQIDKCIKQREYKVGDKVLVGNSSLCPLHGKFWSKEYGPHEIVRILSYGVLEVKKEGCKSFLINGQRVKRCEEKVGTELHPIGVT